MIMILLVTAYNGRDEDGGQTIVTANTFVSLACALPGWRPCWASPRHVLLVGASSSIGSRHALPEATRIANGIIEQYSFASETWASYTKCKFCISRKRIINCYTLCIYMIWYFYGRFLLDQGKRRSVLTFAYVFTSALVCPYLYMVLYPCRYLEKQTPAGMGGVRGAAWGIPHSIPTTL